MLRLIVFNILILLISLEAFSASDCFQQYVQKTNYEHQSALSQLDLSQPIKSVTSRGTILIVTFQDKKKFVLRFHDTQQEKNFELFILNLFTDYKRIAFIPTQEVKLSVRQFREILDKLNEKTWNERYQNGKLNLKFITAYPFVEGDIGSDYLEMEFPGVKKDLVLWTKLPDPIKRQLSDAWVMSYIFGVEDFYFQNWMINNDLIIVFDFTMLSSLFLEGKYGFNQNHPLLFCSPLVEIEPSRPMLEELRKGISNNLREYLHNIEEEKIEVFAQKAGFKINATQLEGMMGRINDILEK